MKKAFSLTELMIVLAIISMIMGTMKVYVKHQRIQAEARSIVECVKIYEVALTMYYLRNGGTFPPNCTGEKLEEVEALAPYRPIDFNTSTYIHSPACTGITIMEDYTGYGIRISFDYALVHNTKLVSEVIKQLNASGVASQIGTQESNPEKSTPDGGVNYGGSIWVFFYLKKENYLQPANIYI